MAVGNRGIAGSRVRLRSAADNRLVASIRRGEVAAFEALHDRHAAELLSFCVYMLGSRQDAEDAVQASFVSAYRALLADGRAVTLRPWLFTIARNECLSILRKRRPTVELNGEVALTGDPVKRLELREEIQRLLADMRLLPEHERAALVLAEVHGLSQREIGSVLGVRPQQVKAYIYQARSNLLSEKRAREADCAEIREELAIARGAGLLRGRLRRHVRSCEGCRAYADGVTRQHRQLVMLFPVGPAFALKYDAFEQALGIASADPATAAGGATIGASAAGAAAEFASGGIKALAVKLAAGALAVGAGVGVSVLDIHHVAASERASAAATSPRSTVRPAGSVGATARAAYRYSALRDAHLRSRQPGVGQAAPATPPALRVRSGRPSHQAGESPAPVATTVPGGTGTGSKGAGGHSAPSRPGSGSSAPGQGERQSGPSAKSEESRREREEDQREREERTHEREEDQRERESHKSEGKPHPPTADEGEAEEHEPVGVSRSPRTQEEREQKREERRRKHEEHEAEQEAEQEQAPSG